MNPDRIYQARADAKLTQADVAYRIRAHGHKANERSIRRWESGQHAPHANVVPALAEALGITIDSLYASSDSDDEEDEAALRRFAHVAIDSGNLELAIAMLGRAALIHARKTKGAAPAVSEHPLVADLNRRVGDRRVRA